MIRHQEQQLGLFAMEAEPVAGPPAASREWWLSDDVDERRAGMLRSAEFWQKTHEASGLKTATEDSIYAGRLRLIASDMEARPEFYRAKPQNVTDFRWFFGREE